ncbi:GTP cyclohydrolase I [Neorickettsia findlayensis]|uniref:GTP cyclohydrolase I n=1 Tax=Neorickettsia findlayensis TaxID=2686014 RepID=UPI001F2D9610|nr:GTP cyclohydrolase I [Neorickettsia findlayensis]
MVQKLSEGDVKDFFDLGVGETDHLGLRGASHLFLKILANYFSGYACSDFSSLIMRMENPDGGESLLVLKRIPFLSLCEHHVLPISGYISIGYIPDKTITTLGSLGRLVSACTKRLQLQERICAQIALAIEESLSPKGVIVYASARHACVAHSTSIFESVAKRGAFAANTKGEVQEFFSILK